MADGEIVELFGAAITAVLPKNSCNMSKLRQIPDNQEVFTHPHTDQSLIIEIMEYVRAADDEAALRVHYTDIEESNDATNCDVYPAEVVPSESLAAHQCSSVLYLRAKQCVSKYNEVARNEVDVHLALFRLPEYTTDIVVSFNDPVIVNLDSSSHAPMPTHSSPWTLDDFRRIIHTLTIVDESLFAP